MKKFYLLLNKFKSIHTGAEADFCVEHRLINIIAFSGGFIGLGTTIINIGIGAPVLQLLFGMFAMVFSITLFYFSRFRNKFGPAKWLLTLAAFGIFAFFFFINNGSRGPLLYLYMAFFPLILFVWNGKERLFFIMLFLLNIAAFFFIEMKFPNAVQPYAEEATRLKDVYFSYFMYLALVGAILMFAKNSYISEKKKAEKSDRLKTAFLANMSHEIRTPMNAILGFNQLLYRDLTKERKENYLRVIDENSRSLLRLLEDIIDVSKIEAGELTLRESSTDIQAVMKEVGATIKQSLAKYPDKKIDVIIRYPEKDLHLMVDKTRLRQVLINLLSNSLKYTEKGEIVIGCELEGDFVKFYVRDTGTGIKEEHLLEIFDRFRKIETQGSYNVQPGTGIGLSISRNLVQLMGGEIGVVSEYGSGSEFNFTIPNNPAPPSMEKEAKVRFSNLGEMNLKGKVILVAEDEKMNFEFLLRLIEQTGATVIHAWNGKEAVDMVAENKDVNMVLMDIMMPVMDGYEAARLIKQMHPNLPVIAQSALAMEGDADKMLKSGCDDYIVKPIRLNELLIIIEKHFDNKTVTSP
ncbi:MAG: ATP-binding protein [Bacteroidales bacterium]